MVLFAVFAFAAATPALAAEGTTLRKQSWSWQGVFGTYDEAQS